MNAPTPHLKALALFRSVSCDATIAAMLGVERAQVMAWRRGR